MEKVDSQLSKLGLQRVPIESKGRCLFLAIALSLPCVDGNLVRQQIVDYIRFKDDELKRCISCTLSGESIDDYLERMLQTFEWGGEAEIVATSRLYKRTIVVVQPDCEPKEYNPELDQSARENPIYLAYDGVSHYDGVIALASENITGTDELRWPATVIKATFQTFLDRCVTPDQKQVEWALEKQAWLQSRLSGFPIKEILPSGSFSRGTSVHPLHDVDLLAVIDPTVFDGSADDLESVNLFDVIFRCLTQHRSWTETEQPFCYRVDVEHGEHLVVRRQNCSVGICFGKTWDKKAITFDIVPALENSEGVYTIIPHGTENPIPTNPGAAKRLVEETDRQWKGRFRPLVQLAKKWNAHIAISDEQKNEHKPFKSFYLELLCCKFARHNLTPSVLHITRVLHKFFRHLYEGLSALAVEVPGVPDQILAALNDDVWPTQKLRQILSGACEHTTRALQCEREGRMLESLDCWVALFGDQVRDPHITGVLGVTTEADQKVPAGGSVPLILAALDDDAAAVEALLRDGADADQRASDNGDTPIIIASARGNAEIIRTLLRHGANVNQASTGNGWTPLIWASLQGQVEVVEILLEHGADVNQASSKGGPTPLTAAAQEGHTRVVQVLLRRGADVNRARTDDGSSPLFEASRNGHTEAAELLLRHGADINQTRNDDGATPLLTASHEGHTKVEMLLEHGAKVNQAAADDGSTPLMAASQEGHTKVVEMLLRHGADATQKRTDDGSTPFHWACYKGHVAAARVLLGAGIDVNQTANDGSTPLADAAQEGHTGVVELLLQHGADVNQARAGDGATPLVIASESGHAEVVEVLLRHGAEINQATIDDGSTPLFSACSRSSEGHIRVIRLLLRHGADTNRATTDDGSTPLIIASQQGHSQVVEMLLQHKANINQTDHEGYTPLTMASKLGHVEVISVLLRHGANADQASTDKGVTPLIWACLKGDTRVIQVLLRHKADVSRATTNKGITPLIAAIQHGHTEAVEILLRHGVDVTRSTRKGTTPLIAASYCAESLPEVVEMLLQHGAKVNQARPSDGYTPLLAASEEGHTEVVETLLRHGADVDQATTDNGTTPLFEACCYRHPEVVRILLEHGADVNRATTDTGRTPLIVACKEGHAEVVDVLLQHGADINARSIDGTPLIAAIDGTPLIAAAVERHAEIVRLLVRSGAQIDRSDLHQHFGIKCDGCSCHPIGGALYHCRSCTSYDLCSKCYVRSKLTSKTKKTKKKPKGHNKSHKFERVRVPEWVTFVNFVMSNSPK